MFANQPQEKSALPGDGDGIPAEVLLETMREGFLYVGPNWRCAYANSAAARLLRHKVKDLVGRPVLEILPGATGSAFEEGFRRSLNRRIPVAFELHCGLLHSWFECACHPARDGVYILLADVTGRKQAEEAARESEERLRLTLEGGRMGRWEWDIRTGSMSWSERVYELLGVAAFRRASVGVLLEHVHPNDRDGIQRLVARALAGQRDFEAEFRVLRPQENPRDEVPWLASQAQVIRAEPGGDLRLIGVMYDITRRKRMEAELQRLNEHLTEQVEVQTEELRDTVERLKEEVVRRVLAEGNLRRRSQMLEAFFEHTVTPLVFLDRNLNFVRVNRAYAGAAGEDPASFPGQNYFVLRPHEEDRPIFEQVLRTRRPYFARAKPFIDPHNPQRPVTYWNWHLMPLLSAAGQVQALVLNLEDVTEAQEAYATLEHRAGLLQKLTLELSQTEDRERKRISELLHEDVQQVLAGARFHVNLLRQGVREQADLRQMADEVAQMLGEAIAKARGLSHELSPALYQFDLDEMLAWLARNMKERHGLAVELRVRDVGKPPAEPLKALLYKVAQELLFNVVKHAGVTQAKLRLHGTRGRLRLLAADRGQGFDPAALAETAGFGLMSIRERIGLLGGRLKIHSARGKGSTILVAVPLDATSAMLPSDSALK